MTTYYIQIGERTQYLHILKLNYGSTLKWNVKQHAMILRHLLPWCGLNTLKSLAINIPYSLSTASQRVPIMAARDFSPPTLVRRVQSENKNLGEGRQNDSLTYTCLMQPPPKPKINEFVLEEITTKRTSQLLTFSYSSRCVGLVISSTAFCLTFHSLPVISVHR